jgi:hypothetical protein
MSGAEHLDGSSRRRANLRVAAAIAVAPLLGCAATSAAFILALCLYEFVGWGRITNPVGAFLTYVPGVGVAAAVGSVAMTILGLPTLWVLHRFRISSTIAWVAVGLAGAVAVELVVLNPSRIPWLHPREGLSLLEYTILFACAGAIAGYAARRIVRPDRWPRRASIG